MIVPHIDLKAMPLDLIETQLEHHNTAAAIWYSNGSCFWSHLRSASLLFGPEMKCPLGGQIFMERDWRGWLAQAKENPDWYGAHGLKALLAAHHSNVRHPETGGPYAAKTWKPYNAAVDVWKAEHATLDAPKPKIDLKAPANRRPAIIPGPKRAGRR